MTDLQGHLGASKDDLYEKLDNEVVKIFTGV